MVSGKENIAYHRQVICLNFLFINGIHMCTLLCPILCPNIDLLLMCCRLFIQPFLNGAFYDQSMFFNIRRNDDGVNIRAL